MIQQFLSFIILKYSSGKRYRFLFILLILSVTALPGCKKYLDEKPVKTDFVPASLNDLQALLDNNNNYTGNSGVAELVSDNYYVTDADWQNFASSGGSGATLFPSMAGHYIWQSDPFPMIQGWQQPYTSAIYRANVVLDHINTVSKVPGEDAKYNAIKGAALFYRSYGFYQLAQLFAKAYDASTAADDPGIVLRLTSNINERSVRSSVQETYDRAINDLKEAADLLPLTATPPTRPSRLAALAALARVYLSMRNYGDAAHYSNLVLSQYNTLMDYNTLVPVQTPSIKRFNPEVIYHNHNGVLVLMLFPTYAKVSPALYQSYQSADLRKEVFFRTNTGVNAGTYAFRGSYYESGSNSEVFDGFTTGEMFLIRAEAEAKAGDKDKALADLNHLLKTRWHKDSMYVNVTALNANDALQKIRIERRKELAFRGQRWTDLRRYNLEDSSITLKRLINGTEYALPPNDKRWVLLIPWEEVNRSGIEQNPR